MSIKPLIMWQKWLDPFGSDAEDSKWTDYSSDSPEFVYENEEDGDDVLPNKKLNKPVKVIASPMGLIPYNEHTASGKIFNFWTGHTNFNISSEIIDVIDTSDGVETLDIFTRYRFRIGVGKCFEDAVVMSQINKNIYEFLENNI